MIPPDLAGVTHLLEAAGDRRQDLMTGFTEERTWAAQVADHIASISEPIPAFPSRPEARSESRLRTAASRVRLRNKPGLLAHCAQSRQALLAIGLAFTRRMHDPASMASIT
jgi:hypothetical protein